VSSREDEEADFSTGVITVFSPGSNGDASSIATIGGTSGNLDLRIGAAVKPYRGQLCENRRAFLLRGYETAPVP